MIRARGVVCCLVAFLAAHCGDEPSAPRVDSVEPTLVARSVETPLTILGGGFEAEIHGNLESPADAQVDATFEVTLVSDTDSVALSEVLLIDDMTLKAVVPAGVPLGDYDLQLQDPRGQVADLSPALRVADDECTDDADCRALYPCAIDPHCAVAICLVGHSDPECP